MRPIYADDAIYELKRAFPADDFGKIIRCISRTPTAEAVERKRGKWERNYSRPNVFADLYWHCSACGYKNDNRWANVYHLYCPNCGAKMDVVDVGCADGG